MEADVATQAVELGTNTDFSLLSLFFRADIIVKSVMIILILCSVYSWAVIIEKFRLFKKINKSSEEYFSIGISFSLIVPSFNMILVIV